MRVTQLKSHALEQQTEHAIIILDVAGVIVEWDGAASKLFGYSRAEMVGRTLLVLFTPEDQRRGELANELESARSFGRGENDRWMVRKDDSQFWANGVVTPILDSALQIIGFLKILRDRTDIRSQLDTLHNRLEVAQRTDSRKNIFLATLAHELRNPLSALRTSAEILRMSPSNSPESETVFAIIERQVRLMAQLLADVADYARASEGQLKLEASGVDLRSIIDKALETCTSTLTMRRQAVEVRASNPIALEADPVRLQQVFVNLIVNASKFSSIESKIWIRATVEGNEAVVRVEDKGDGIPPEFLPHIFELFTQAAPNTHVRSKEGMGLGLPLVKSLVELHRGSVQAHSEGRGKGTEVTVRLPLAQPKEIEAPSATNPNHLDRGQSSIRATG